MTVSRDWWRDPPKVDRDRGREAIEAACEEIADLKETIVTLIALVKAFADRRVPARACDQPAERAVLGWLLSGKCASADFDELGAYDFTNHFNRWIFGWGLEVLKASECGDLDGHPWPASLRPTRDTLCRLALIQDAEADLGAIERLPFPTAKPELDIALVAALGRGWSVVDQTFNTDPYEVHG